VTRDDEHGPTFRASQAGAATWRTAGHLPVTAAITVCLLSAMGVGATLLGRRFRGYSYGTIATLLVAGGLVGLQTDRIAVNQPTPWMGVAERVSIYATMLWLAVLAIGLVRVSGTKVPQQLGQPTLTPQGAAG